VAGVLAAVDGFLTAAAPKQQHPPSPLSCAPACNIRMLEYYLGGAPCVSPLLWV
jgi:hypothetical protein